MSKTILVSELAGSPELIVGKERQQDWFGYGAWIIADSAWVHGPLWIRRKLDTQYLNRPVNFSNLDQIFSFHPGGAHVSMCDGSVRFLSEAASPEVVFALASRTGAERDEEYENMEHGAAECGSFRPVISSRRSLLRPG